MIKNWYVRLLRGVRRALLATGLLSVLDHLAVRDRTWLWVRSLLAVYDLDDLAALAVPWWTFEASEEVERHLAGARGGRVFEWGSGSSTLWLAERAHSVVSIEHDPHWARRMQRKAPANATVKNVSAVASQVPAARSRKAGFKGMDFRAYVDAIDRDEATYDVVVIDGRARELCLPKALRHLSPGGIVVFDNVERKRYRDAIAGIPDTLQITWTRGLTPCLPYPTRTALIRLLEPAAPHD